MASVLGKLGVRHQIGLVGLVGVAGLMLVGAMYYFGTTRQSAARYTVEGGYRTLQTLDAVKIDLLEARRSEKDFLLRRKEEFTKKHEAAMNAYAQDMANLRGLLDVAQRGMAEQVAAAIAQYAQQFGVVAADVRKIGYDENSGLHGALRDSVHDIETALGGNREASLGNQDPRLMAAMLLMRRHEKDFFQRHRGEYLDKMKEAAAGFDALLSEAQVPAQDRLAMKDKLGAYQRDFFAAAAATKEEDDAITTLATFYDTAAPLLDQLERQVKDVTSTAQSAGQETIVAVGELVGAGIALVGGAVALLALLIGRGVARPMTAMAGVMGRLARGDLTIDVEHSDRRDEIGTLARSFEVFKENAVRTRALEAEQRGEQERKERRQQAIEAYISAFDRSVRDALDTLAAASNEMRATAESMSVTAEETTRQASAVVTASEQTSANVQTVAGSAEEMSISIREISRQVGEASTAAGHAVDEARRTNGTVTTLADAGHKIGQVVQLIQDIASQTNLLALNATIEAARAGDAGKGFAVVASEVKSLAGQTAKATDEIAAQVTSIQSVTDAAVTAIQDIGSAISRVNDISAMIATAIEQQGSATQEIARSTQEAAKGTEQVSSTIVAVNQAAGDTGSAAAQVLASAEQLGRQSETLRRDVNEFLEKIRAA